MKEKVYTETQEWRMYQDKQTIRIEKKVDGKWKVEFVIIRLFGPYSLARRFSYQVRKFEKPGYHKEGPCFKNLEGVIKFIKIRGHIELPAQVIDILESWRLMDIMKKYA